MSAVLEPIPTASTTNQPTELWYTRCPVPTASGIAQHKRWLHGEFERSGIALASIRASQDRAVRESHFRHSLAGSFREGGNVPPLWTRSRGQDTVVVAITWVDEEQYVLVRADSDIQTIADLRGKKLGLPQTASNDLVDVARAESLRGLLTGLKIGGASLTHIKRDEVLWVDLPQPAWELRENKGPASERVHGPTQSLLAGEVDAIFIKGAGSALAQERGLRVILNINEQADPFLRISAGSPRPVTVDRQTLVNSPELVARYLAVLLKTAEWARDNAEDVVTTIAAETGATEAAVRKAFGPKLHLAFEPQLSDLYLRGLRNQKDFLLAEGFIPSDYDFDAWIDPAPLARAHELARTLELRTGAAEKVAA
jgi:sulfonate transport system substrate-binding protein